MSGEVRGEQQGDAGTDHSEAKRDYPISAELEVVMGAVADLRDENKAITAANKAIQAEIISIRKDMMNMNEVIKNLLAIYDVVCKDRNPFLDDESLTLVKVPGKEGSSDGRTADLE
jgi:hypothetical protein